MDAHERLQHARALAGYSGPADAADALGIKRPTYYGHENGARGFLDDAERYAKFFRVSYEWLTTGRGEPRQSSVDARVLSLPTDARQQLYDYLEFLESKGGRRDVG